MGTDKTITHHATGPRRLGHFGAHRAGRLWRLRRGMESSRYHARSHRGVESAAPLGIGSRGSGILLPRRSARPNCHPNIVSVHEVGRDGDTVFIASDFIEGANRRTMLGSSTIREATELVANIAEALQHAHEHGVVHRDLKPANILMDSHGTPHVMDFGLARRESGEVTMTVDGKVLGTPAYMSPEQARGKAHEAMLPRMFTRWA